MSNDIQSFLTKIDSLNNTTVDVFSPSKNKMIKCAPLSFKQQKEIIGTIADGGVGTIRFQKILNDIILENSKDDNLSVIDKLPILLSLRANSIKSDIVVDGVSVSIETLVKKYVDTYSTYIKNSPSDKITFNGIDVVLQLPTLKDDSKVLTEAIAEVKKMKEGEASKNIGNIYTYEILKYVKSVTIGEDTITFADTSVKNRFSLINALPVKLNQHIVDFIEFYKQFENDVLTFVHQNGDKSTFDIDVGFFDA